VTRAAANDIIQKLSCNGWADAVGKGAKLEELLLRLRGRGSVVQVRDVDDVK
jgi:hypothetical protein